MAFAEYIIGKSIALVLYARDQNHGDQVKQALTARPGCQPDLLKNDNL
jgi:hypothetical protein